MQRLMIAIFTVVFAGDAFCAQTVTRIEAPGNLEAKAPLDCVALNDIASSSTPAEIIPGAAACLRTGRPHYAIRMLMIAGVYGRYDALRVADKSAHQAIAVLRLNHLRDLSETQRQSLEPALQALRDPASTEFLEVCGTIRKIGAPTYFPKYMIQHGMAAFSEPNGNGIVEAFSPAAAWDEALDQYLHCPKP